MKTLRSYVSGEWYEASTGFRQLVDPCSEEPIARASSAGLDFGGALDFARQHGRRALGGMTIGARAELLAAMSRTLHEHREELNALSVRNTGTTRKDAKFDVDGGSFTLAHYAALGKEIGDEVYLRDGAGIQLGRSARFWGQHVWVPLAGVAVHVNAFNFPVWGFAEKAACALLAGMPLITKPATSSALVTERCVEILVDADIVPPGVISLVCGSSGDLLDRLGGQDVLAFTGSASTALELRGKANLLASSARVNIEADSLNAAVLGADVAEGSETWQLFVRDVLREMTQKTGQKCTAVRRILVPRESEVAAREALRAGLEQVVTGNPLEPSVTMGPLATAQQLEEAVSGVARLRQRAKLAFGSGERGDGVGNPAGQGYFFGPVLLVADDPRADAMIHELEVFGPVATLMAYDGSAFDAAALVSLGGGSLVTSLYSDDLDFASKFLADCGWCSGRLYLGSEKVAAQLPGSGLALPHVLHGGPGRAGGGAELGGTIGLQLYMQRLALTGDRVVVERLSGTRDGRER